MKSLFRDRWNKKIGGVCGGLGVYFGIDPTVVRVLFILFSIITFFLPILALYIILWLLLPEGPNVYIEPKGKRLFRSKKDRRLSGICGGLGAYFNIDSNIIRIIIVAASFLSFGTVPLVYFLSIFVIPEQPRYTERD